MNEKITILQRGLASVNSMTQEFLEMTSVGVYLAELSNNTEDDTVAQCYAIAVDNISDELLSKVDTISQWMIQVTAILREVAGKDEVSNIDTQPPS